MLVCMEAEMGGKELVAARGQRLEAGGCSSVFTFFRCLASCVHAAAKSSERLLQTQTPRPVIQIIQCRECPIPDPLLASGPLISAL